jgi:glycosyltransferase involved in cell wall biosynthesis
MTTPVSIIIPCYNQAHFLAEAVQSALDQDYPNKEVIVVNDGSPDNTREVAVSFGDRIVYIEQENRGLSGARNTGIRAAGGDYIAFLDSDDAYLPGALSIQADWLNRHSDIAMVCGDARLYDGKQTFGRKSGWSGRPVHPENFRWETVEYCATPSTVMLRRSVLNTVGFFDETLKNAAEDWLMWVRMSKHFNMAYLDQPLIYYRVHDWNATRNVERINRGNRYAVAVVVDDPGFAMYPAHFRAKLLFYRFATAWWVEPKMRALGFLLRALSTDPRQIPYGLRVVRQGIRNALRRRREG